MKKFSRGCLAWTCFKPHKIFNARFRALALNQALVFRTGRAKPAWVCEANENSAPWGASWKDNQALVSRSSV